MSDGQVEPIPTDPEVPYPTWNDHRALLERDGDLVRPVA